MSDQGAWLEETAIVVDHYPGGVWVETSPSLGCAGCKAGSCGTRWFSRWISTPRLAVDTELGLRIGDRVRVGVPSRAFLRGALMMYGWPLSLAMVAGGVTERVMSPGHPYVPIMFAGGLLFGMLLGRWYSWRHSKSFRPVLLTMK